MRQWKIGTITAGLLLISLGVLWLGNNIWDLPIHTLISNAWPVLLIVLGIEVLVHQFFKKEEGLKFDGFSIFLVIVLGFASMIIYGAQSIGILPAISNVVNGEKYSRDIQLTEAAVGVEEFVVEIPNGDITVTGSDTKEVKVEGTLKITAENEEKANDLLEKSVTLKKIGNKLLLEVEMPKNQSIFGWHDYDGAYNIVLPKELYVKMDVANGDIQGKDLHNGAQFNLVNGDLELSNITKQIKVNNQNGSISVNEWDGELIATLTNGDIDVKTSKITSAIEIETTNGDVSATLPKNAVINIEGETENGEVGGDVNWIRSADKDDHDHETEGELILGSGTHPVELSSVNGDVTVKTE